MHWATKTKWHCSLMALKEIGLVCFPNECDDSLNNCVDEPEQSINNENTSLTDDDSEEEVEEQDSLNETPSALQFDNAKSETSEPVLKKTLNVEDERWISLGTGMNSKNHNDEVLHSAKRKTAKQKRRPTEVLDLRLHCNKKIKANQSPDNGVGTCHPNEIDECTEQNPFHPVDSQGRCRTICTPPIGSSKCRNSATTSILEAHAKNNSQIYNKISAFTIEAIMTNVNSSPTDHLDETSTQDEYGRYTIFGCFAWNDIYSVIVKWIITLRQKSTPTYL